MLASELPTRQATITAVLHRLAGQSGVGTAVWGGVVEARESSQCRCSAGRRESLACQGSAA